MLVNRIDDYLYISLRISSFVHLFNYDDGLVIGIIQILKWSKEASSFEADRINNDYDDVWSFGVFVPLEPLKVECLFFQKSVSEGSIKLY